MLLFFLYTTNINYQNIVEKNFIYYYIIAIKWGESTHFPRRNDPKVQQGMDNSKQLVTLTTQGTERKQRKQNTQHRKLKR